MSRVSVASDMMCSVCHDPETSILEIEFRNGSLYAYFDVPRDHYEALLLATSKGKFFNAYLRGVFHFTRTR